MKIKIALLFFLVTSLTFAQNDVDGLALISTEHLKSDLQIMKSNLLSIHPGLYEYLEKEELDELFVQLEEELTKPMSDIAFYRLLAPLQSKIRNGHTMIIPSENWDAIKVGRKFFPFEIYWDSGHLYVLKNLSEDLSVGVGTAIKSINGESAKKVVDELINSITQDGNNSTFPLHLLQLGFAQWYADIKGTPETFEFEFVEKNQASQTKRVLALSLKKIKGNHLARYKEEKVPWYQKEDTRALSLKIKNEVGVLTVPTFDSSEKSGDGKKYKRFYKEVFKQIKASEINQLILDVRDNGGGDPKPQLALLNHLIDEPLRLYKRVYAVARKIPNPKLYKDDKVGGLNLLSKLVLKKRDDVYEETGNLFARMSGATSRKPKSPAKDLYKGELYILTDGGSFSATGEVAGLLKEYDRGIFIGEETGGSDYQNSSGVMLMLYLPHSQVRVRIPMLCYELNVDYENDGKGVLPDHLIRKSIGDVLNKRDAVLDYTLELIEKN